MPGALQSMGSQRVGHSLVTENIYTYVEDILSEDICTPAPLFVCVCVTLYVCVYIYIFLVSNFIYTHKSADIF